MPKNPKNPSYPPIRPVPPTPQPTDPDCGGGGGVDLLPPEPLLLVLDRVDPAAVASLQATDPVILRIDALPIVVTTLLGVPIGEVRLDDVEAVRRRRARRGVVAVAQTHPLACAVEVSR